VQRILAFSASTLVIILAYSIIVGVLGLVVQQRFNFVTSVIAAAIIAVLFHPIRQWFQRKLNERLFGQRDDPYQVLRGLSQRAASNQDPFTALQEVAESTAKVLKLPYIAIILAESQHNPVVHYGQKLHEDILRLPLNYESKVLGQLELSRRAEGEYFNHDEETLLSTIAQQVSVIADNYLLTQALQASREQLVLSREEERKRIRRDLHDGLGPTLASTALQLETAQQLIYSEPEKSLVILRGLEHKMTQTLNEVRTLVHDLYPTAIDQHGLYEALKREVKSFEGRNLKVFFEVKGSLDNLPAALEVASYRIVMEALHNVVKHAGGTEARAYLNRTPYELEITISDNGIGFINLKSTGAGLASIRERTEELGGKLHIDHDQQGTWQQGTQIFVSLPIKHTDDMT
ncbi:MAG: histidine kinase, partial [Deinococcales bacterium]